MLQKTTKKNRQINDVCFTLAFPPKGRFRPLGVRRDARCRKHCWVDVENVTALSQTSRTVAPHKSDKARSLTGSAPRLVMFVTLRGSRTPFSYSHVMPAPVCTFDAADGSGTPMAVTTEPLFVQLSVFGLMLQGDWVESKSRHRTPRPSVAQPTAGS